MDSSKGTEAVYQRGREFREIAARLCEHMTQRDLAIALGMYDATLSKKMRGLAPVSVVDLLAIRQVEAQRSTPPE